MSGAKRHLAHPQRSSGIPRKAERPPATAPLGTTINGWPNRNTEGGRCLRLKPAITKTADTTNEKEIKPSPSPTPSRSVS
jgi:hypothetical protein